jgi:hypothetical protein
VYAAVVTVNFLAIILGVTTGLAALGLEYLARLAASGCESVYMYAAMRWLVFRDAAGPAAPPGGQADPVPVTDPPPEQDAAGQTRCGLGR